MPPCSWEGNRRSGVALSMHYRLKWFVHLLRKGDEHPAYIAPITLVIKTGEYSITSAVMQSAMPLS